MRATQTVSTKNLTFSKEATLFTNLKAASNWTTSTTASLMTGKRLWTHLSAHLQGKPPLKSDIESLPLLLKQNGYFNMAFVANKLARVDRIGVADSFDIVPSLREFTTIHSLLGELGIIDVLLYPTFKEQVQQQRLRLGFYNPDISWVCC